MDLIIGAGISGLSYAYFCKHNDYLIVEKEGEIGGYCKTIKRNGYIWDYSGHFFHFSNPNIKNHLISKIGEDNLMTISRKSKIKYEDLYIDYPFQNNIHQLNKEDFIDCLYDLFINENDLYSNFIEMLYCKYGKSIAEKFLIPYNEKLYACSLNNLDKDSMGRFFPYAEKLDIIKNFKKSSISYYNDNFIYPKNGAIEYINAFTSGLKKENLILNSQITTIDTRNKIAYTDNGKIKYDRIISSMPFPALLDICNINYDKTNYSWNKVLVFNLGFDKKGNDKTSHWIYFPEKKFCFYRVGYYDNILNQNKMSLYVEIGFNNKVSINASKCLNTVLQDLNIANITKDHVLIDYHYVIMNPAYVHINSKSIRDVMKMKERLKKNDIYSIGRYGSWTYCSLEDNIMEAMNLANRIN